MNKGKIMRKYLSLSLLLLIMLICGGMFYSCKDKQYNNISVEVVYNSEQVYYAENISSKKKYVFGLLEELNANDENLLLVTKSSEYGQYITSLCGIAEKVEGSTMFYWSFYVNNSYASSGVSSQKLSEGLKIKFVYESYNLN